MPKEHGASSTEIEACAKENEVIPKENGVLPKENGACAKENGAVPKENGVFPKESEAFLKEIEAFPKENGAFPKENGGQPKEFGAHPQVRAAFSRARTAPDQPFPPQNAVFLADLGQAASHRPRNLPQPRVPPLAATVSRELSMDTHAAQWWVGEKMENQLSSSTTRASLRGEEQEGGGEERVPRVMAPAPDFARARESRVPPLAATVSFELSMDTHAAQWWLGENMEDRVSPSVIRTSLRDGRASLRGEEEEGRGEERVPRVMAPTEPWEAASTAPTDGPSPPVPPRAATVSLELSVELNAAQWSVGARTA